MSNERKQDIPRVEPNRHVAHGNGRRDYSTRPAVHVSWGEVDNQHIRDAVVQITDAGAAVLFGRTSDGGALSITVLDGETRVREWPHTSQAAESTLAWLVGMFSPD